MTQFTTIKDNFKEIASQTILMTLMPQVVDEELYSKTMKDIFKDLGRSYFIDTNDKTFDDFLNAWTQDDVFKSYTQGNITAEIFSVLFQNFIFTSQKFANSEKKRTNTEESRLLYIQRSQSLSFSYFDDENRLCGFSLSYSKEDPSLWFAAKICQTTLSPELKQVTILSHTDILNVPQAELIDEKGVGVRIGELLGSVSLKNRFENILLPDGSINNEKFDSELHKINENKKINHETNQAKVKIRENQYKTLYTSFVNSSTQYKKIQENSLEDHEKSTYLKFVAIKESLKCKETLTENTFQERLEITKTQFPHVLEPSFFKRNKFSLLLGALGLIMGFSLLISGSLLLVPAYATSLIILGVSAILFALIIFPLKILLDEKPVVAYSQLIKQHDEEKSNLHTQLNKLNYDEYKKTQELKQTNKLKELEAPFEKECRKSLSEPLNIMDYNHARAQQFFTNNDVDLQEPTELQYNDTLNLI